MARLSPNIRKIVLNLWKGWRTFLGLSNSEAQLLAITHWQDHYGRLTPEAQRNHAVLLLKTGKQIITRSTINFSTPPRQKALDHVHVYLGDLPPQTADYIYSVMNEYNLSLYAVIKILLLLGIKTALEISPDNFWTIRQSVIAGNFKLPLQ
ncbi:MAG: hypothetical protein ABIN54_09050 [candidate division WOR-3 bacterium]